RGRAHGRGGGAGGATVGRGLVQVLGGRVDPRQPGAGPGGGLARPGGDRHQVPAPVAAARAGPGRAAAGVGAAGAPPERAARRGRGAHRPGGTGQPPGGVRGVPGRPGLRGAHRRPRRTRAGRARGGRPARRGCRLGGASGLPSRPAAARDSGGRGRDGDQRAQGPARLHAGRAGAGPDRADRAFEATHTTSPAGTITASIDAARALLARDGTALCARLLGLAAAARQRLARVPGVDVLDGPGVEPTKLVVLLAGAGAHGNGVEADLIAAGMPVEMADRDTIIPILTIADDEAAVERFTGVLMAAIERHRGAPRPPVPSPAWTVTPQVALPPREAFFAPNETVGADAAVGRISAE